MSVKIPIADVTTAVWYGLLLVRLWRKDPESSVLPIVVGVTSSNHSGCGGLRRRVTKACPICSSRVAKPAFAVPIGGSPRERFPSQFDLALHVSLPGGDLHTQERSQYCRTGFPICSSRLPSGAFLPSLQVLTTAKRIGLPLCLFNCRAQGFSPEAHDLETRGHLISSFKSVFLSGPSRSSPENSRYEATCKAFGTRQPLVRAAREIGRRRVGKE